MRGDPSGIARGARSRCLVRPFLPGRLTLHAVGSTTPVRLSTAFDAWGPRAGSALRTAGAGVLGVGDVSGLVWTTTPAGGFLTGHGYLTIRRDGSGVPEQERTKRRESRGGPKVGGGPQGWRQGQAGRVRTGGYAPGMGRAGGGMGGGMRAAGGPEWQVYGRPKR